MRVLALEPYYGGSHRAFLDGWAARSRHDWTVLALPPHKWKWRMRHAAITFAADVRLRVAAGESWDVLFCSDMLNLSEFVGLAPPGVQAMPKVVYFHENQLTYPVRDEKERDWHFAFTNLTTALCADAVWFNSGFHRDAFLEALPVFLRRMPDHQPVAAAESIHAKSVVQYPGVDEFSRRGDRAGGPLRILWAARWEHDKDPETFFSALGRVEAAGADFRLSVIGEQFRESPNVFDRARARFAPHIDRWGYQATREDYVAALCEADVIVSTALHEFFGISVVEAISAGAYPLLPRRLSYPELLAAEDDQDVAEYFYDGSAEALANRLIEISGVPPPLNSTAAQRAVRRFRWDHRAAAMDAAIECVRANRLS